MKFYKFSYTRKPFATKLEGSVATENFVQWLSENAPYGVRVVGYSEVTEEEFKNLHDLSKQFSTQNIIDQIDVDNQEEE